MGGEGFQVDHRVCEVCLLSKELNSMPGIRLDSFLLST